MCLCTEHAGYISYPLFIEAASESVSVSVSSQSQYLLRLLHTLEWMWMEQLSLLFAPWYWPLNTITSDSKPVERIHKTFVSTACYLIAPPSVHMDDEPKFDWPLASLPDGERSGEGNFKKCQLHLSMCRYCRCWNFQISFDVISEKIKRP